MADKTTHQ